MRCIADGVSLYFLQYLFSSLFIVYYLLFFTSFSLSDLFLRHDSSILHYSPDRIEPEDLSLFLCLFFSSFFYTTILRSCDLVRRYYSTTAIRRVDYYPLNTTTLRYLKCGISSQPFDVYLFYLFIYLSICIATLIAGRHLDGVSRFGVAFFFFQL